MCGLYNNPVSLSPVNSDNANPCKSSLDTFSNMVYRRANILHNHILE